MTDVSDRKSSTLSVTFGSGVAPVRVVGPADSWQDGVHLLAELGQTAADPLRRAQHMIEDRLEPLLRGLAPGLGAGVHGLVEAVPARAGQGARVLAERPGRVARLLQRGNFLREGHPRGHGQQARRVALGRLPILADRRPQRRPPELEVSRLSLEARGPLGGRHDVEALDVSSGAGPGQ